jgi:hypothetical protein
MASYKHVSENNTSTKERKSGIDREASSYKENVGGSTSLPLK